MKTAAPPVTSGERAPAHRNWRKPLREKTAYRDEDSGPARHKWRAGPPLTATGESRSVRSPRTAMKTVAPPVTSGEWPRPSQVESGHCSPQLEKAAAVRSPRTAMKRVARLITSGEWPPLVQTRVAPAHRNWRKSTQQQKPSTAKNKPEKESDTSQVFRNYNVS